MTRTGAFRWVSFRPSISSPKPTRIGVADDPSTGLPNSEGLVSFLLQVESTIPGVLQACCFPDYGGALPASGRGNPTTGDIPQRMSLGKPTGPGGRGIQREDQNG
jgi:hypothetical protein